MDQAALSPPKKRTARHFSVEDKERVLNIFKACAGENPDNPKTQNVEFTAKAAGNFHFCIIQACSLVRPKYFFSVKAFLVLL